MAVKTEQSTGDSVDNLTDTIIELFSNDNPISRVMRLQKYR